MLFTTIAMTASSTAAHGAPARLHLESAQCLYVCGILGFFMAGAFECNEYQDVYLTAADLEEASLGTVLRPGESEVSGLMMEPWDEVEAALLRQDTVGHFQLAPQYLVAQC